METPVVKYKTKPYTLKAIRAYYARNKEQIIHKLVSSRFIKKANLMMDTMELGNDYIKIIMLFKLSGYKQYQIDKDVRMALKPRLLSIIKDINQTNQDFSFLRIAPYGDEDDNSYDGNYL
jgi:hypothetical protein